MQRKIDAGSLKENDWIVASNGRDHMRVVEVGHGPLDRQVKVSWDYGGKAVSG